jgi:hypothetical protein
MKKLMLSPSREAGPNLNKLKVIKSAIGLSINHSILSCIRTLYLWQKMYPGKTSA